METSLLKKRLWNSLLLILALLFVGISYAHEIIPNRNSIHRANSATVFTDKDDYQPGEYVVVSGSGWLPGETVQLHFDETPQVCTSDHDRYTVADFEGNIYYNQFLINDRHLGVAFVLTATGQSSGYNAQTFFTDATWGLEVSTNGGSSYLNNSTSPTVLFSSCETKQITFRLTQQNNTNPNQSYTFALPAGFAISLPSSLAFFNAANNSISKSWSVSQYATNAICLSASSSSDALGANQKIVFTCNVTSVANVASTEITGRANSNATCLNPTGSTGVLMNITRPKFSSSADTTPPVLTPGDNQNVTLGSDCKILIPNVKGSATDNCSGVSIVQDPAEGELVSSSHNGNIVVTVTATDAAGVTDVEEVTLIAKDETPPVLTPGDNQDVVLGSDCKIEIPDVTGSAVDNCSGVNIVQNPVAGAFVSSSHNGNIVVTVTATGAAGLTDIEEVMLIAKDTTPPVLTPGDNQDVVLGSDCKILIPNVKGSATDNCSGVSIVQDPAEGELVSGSHNGNIVVTVTATDAAGLTDVEEVTLIAKDTTPPVLTPGDNQDVVLGSDCKILIPNVKGSATDNCSGVNIVQDPVAGAFVSSSHNGNIVVTVTATDAAGLTDVEEVTLTAKDTTPPVLTPGDNQDVTLGSDCKILIPNVTGSAVDNCSGVNIVQNPVAGAFVSSSHNGNIVVTVTATDAAGLTDIEEVTLTAKDETSPSIVCPENIELSACQSTATWSVPSASDNCSGVTVERIAGPAPGSSIANGEEVTVTYRATDGGGNTKDCSFTIKRASTLSATISSDKPVLYFGYPGDQSATITATPIGGTAPYTIKISMRNAAIASQLRGNGKLICDYVNATGDEVWTPGLNTNLPLSTGITCTTNSVQASSISNPIGLINNGANIVIPYSVNVKLLADARFIATITDAKGCTFETPWEDAAKVEAEDVRCFAGNSGVPKITICHKTGSSKNPCVAICVDESAVAEHLAHGDFLGKCNPICSPATANSRTEIHFNVIAYPNPSNNQFTFEIESESSDNINISVFDIAGRLVKQLQNNKATTVTFGEELPRGVYLAVIEQGNNRKTLRVIKE